jgi:hypothetical protein
VSLVLVALQQPGCTTDSALVNDPVPSAPRFESIRQLPADGAVSAADLVPGHDGVEVWVSVEGLLAPNEFDLTTTESAILAGTTSTRTADLETAHWRVAADGSISLERVDSHPDATASLFDPPLLIAPASLTCGADVHAESLMRAVRLPKATSERDRGLARRTVRYARDEDVRWRGEEHRMKVIEVTFTADLSAAQVERKSELWVLPGLGIVAERWRERLVILKLFPKESGQFAYRR